MDYFDAHRKLIAMNIFAFVLVVFMVLMFTNGLDNISRKDKEIFARFLALERKIEKSEAKLHRIEAIKHEVKLLEKEWQYILKNLNLLTEKEKRIEEMDSEVSSMKKTVSKMEKRLNIKTGNGLNDITVPPPKTHKDRKKTDKHHHAAKKYIQKEKVAPTGDQNHHKHKI